MSRKGNCYDNAFIESFWSTLKYELVYHHRFTTHAEARTAIFDYIETLVIDRTGRVRLTREGYNSSEATFRRDLTQLLESL